MGLDSGGVERSIVSEERKIGGVEGEMGLERERKGGKSEFEES